MSQHHAPSSQEAIDARKGEVEGHTESHGHSRAAWTAVAIVSAGALVASIATIFAVVWLVIIGLVVMAAGGIVGYVMGRAGLGQQQHGGSGGSDSGQGRRGEKKVVR